jgi:hypothetical protein
MRGGLFCQLGCPHRLLDCTLYGLLIEMVPTNNTAARVGRFVAGGEDPELTPLGAGCRILPFKGPRQHDAMTLIQAIIFIKLFGLGKLFA